MTAGLLAIPSDGTLDIPKPQLLLWELPFWLLLTACALVPGSAVPMIEWGGLALRATEVAVIAVAIFYCAAALFDRRHWASFTTAGWMLGGFLLLLLLGGLSLSWSGLDGEGGAAMGYTLISSAAAALVAWGVMGGYSSTAADNFLWRFSAFLALISLLYAAESVLSLGLRSELGQNTFMDFGIERVKGPLYGSSTGYLALLPAMAFAIQHALERFKRRLLAAAIVLPLLMALLGLGSRAALVLLGVFLVLVALMMRDNRKRIAGLALVAVFTAVAAIMIFSRATTDRLQSFQDDSRQSTHRTALRQLERQDLWETLRGAGYGAVWNWYAMDSRQGERLAGGDNVIRTPDGVTLYHSHSTFLCLAIELGLAGLIGFALIVAAPGRLLLRCWRRGESPVFLAGLAASSLAFFFDLFLLKNTLVNMLWWIYALGAVMIQAAPRRPATPPSMAPEALWHEALGEGFSDEARAEDFSNDEARAEDFSNDEARAEDFSNDEALAEESNEESRTTTCEPS